MLKPYHTPDVIEAGCDEAGRGCLAGPVFAAAVILPPDFHNELLNDSKQLTERRRYQLREVIERENRGNTATGYRIAICDVMHSGAAKTAVSAVTIRDGVDYGAPDKRRVKLIFMITGKSDSDEHKRVKEKLQKLLSDPTFTAQLCASQDQKAFLALFDQKENRHVKQPPR